MPAQTTDPYQLWKATTDNDDLHDLVVAKYGLNVDRVGQALARVYDVTAPKYGAAVGVDSTVGIRSAIADAAAAGGGTVVFPHPGVWIVAGSGSTPAITLADNVTLDGARGTVIQAKAGVDFEDVIYASGKTNVHVRNITVDANQANRNGVMSYRFNGMTLSSMTDSTVEFCTVKNTRGPYPRGTANGIAFSGTATRCRIIGCSAVDCGQIDPTADITHDPWHSDGFYISGGSNNLILGCSAYNTTDTAFVLEGTNTSGIASCQAFGVRAVAGISSKGSLDCHGNYIDGLTVYDWSASGSGGIAIGPTGSGSLFDTRISGVTLIRVAGEGPAIYVQQIGASATGRTGGVTIEDVQINGSSQNGIVVEHADDVRISGGTIRGITASQIVQIGTDCNRVRVVGVHGWTTSTIGMSSADGNTDVVFSGNTIHGDTVHLSYGIYFFGTHTTSAAIDNYVYGFLVSGAPVGADAGSSAVSVVTPRSTESGWTLGPGGDTNLYRNGADTLHTDDTLEVDLDIVLSGPNRFLYGTTQAGARVKLLRAVPSGGNDFTRLLAATDAGGIQLSNQGASVAWGTVNGPANTTTNNAAGPSIKVGRNPSAGTEGPAAGAIALTRADGSVYYLWVDAAGKLRLHTAAPTGSSGAPTVSDTAGTVVGTQT